LKEDEIASGKFLDYLKWVFSYEIEENFSKSMNRLIEITLNLLELMCENSFTKF
jgi:hypothetical protein